MAVLTLRTYLSRYRGKWDEVTINSGNGSVDEGYISFPDSSRPCYFAYAEVNPIEGTISGEMAKAFKARVEELSGGNVSDRFAGQRRYGF